MKPTKVLYTCSQCEHEFNVVAHPLIQAQTYGPAELCYPEEGGEIEPDECPACGNEIDAEDISDLVADANERPDRDDP